MRELSRREFAVLLIFPGLLVAGIYYFAFDGPARSAVTQQQQSIATLRRTVAGVSQSIAAAQKIPVPPIPLAQEEIARLSDQIEAQKRWVAFNAHPWPMVPTRWTTAAGRIDALHAVASTFEANGLVILSRQTESDSKRVVPKEFEDFADAVKNDGDHPVPEVWRIEFVGSYRDMLAALDQVGRSDAFIVPLAVAMEVLPDDTTRRSWTLWLWV